MDSAFISYSTNDRDLAKRLHSDLRTRGVEVFQFEETAVPGDAAWPQVAESIQNCDWFLVLLTATSVASTPVGKEIEYAHYFQVNSESSTPSIIPLMVEKVDKPPVIAPTAELPFADYDEGIEKLVKLMGLGAAPVPAPKRVADLLHVRVTPSARKVPARDTMHLKVVVENGADTPLEDMVVRLSNAIVAGPFSLAARATQEIQVPVSFPEPGKKRRSVRVSATTPSGTQITTSGHANISVGAATKPEAAPGKLPSQSVVEGSIKEEQEFGTGSYSYSASGEWAQLAAVLVAGILFTWGAHFGTSALLDWYQVVTDPPGWLSVLPRAASGWPPSVRWLIGLVGVAGCLRAGFMIAEEYLISDIPEALLATLWSALVGVSVGLVWSYLFTQSVHQPLLIWGVAGAVGLSGLGVAMYIFLEEIF